MTTIAIIIDKIMYRKCNNWLIDMLKCFSSLNNNINNHHHNNTNNIDNVAIDHGTTKQCLGLNLNIHHLVIDNQCQLEQKLELIAQIFQHTKKLIEENVPIDITIWYSTFSFAKCHKLLLQIMNQIVVGEDKKNNDEKHVVVDHKSDLKIAMTLFHARLY